MTTPNRIKPENCTISGDSFAGTVTRILSVSRAKGPDSKHGTVLLVEMTRGKIVAGAPITISAKHGTISDQVGQIEKERQKILFALASEQVGVSLAKLRLKRIAQIL